MLRLRAVRSILLEDVGGLRSEGSEALDAAIRRCRWVIGFDWAAIVVLVALHGDAGPQLAVGATPQTVFTLGILAVAVHSGFRLGQLEKLRAIRRVVDELDERAE